MESVHGSALGLVFRVSRLLGIAPVTFSRCNVHLSRPLLVCSIVFFTIINCMLFAGLAMDMKAEPHRSHRVESNASALVWVANLSNIMLISAVGVYFASGRVKCITRVLTAVNKMKRKIADHKLCLKNFSDDKKLRVVCMCLILSNLGLIFSDIYKYTEATIDDNKDVIVMILYNGFYYEFLCFTLFECQFIVIASEVRNVLTMVTDGLEESLNTVMAAQSIKRIEVVGNGNYFVKPTAVNVSSINSFIDKMSAGVFYAEKYPDRLEVRVHALATVFGDACDLVRDVNGGFGLQLLLILMSFFLELIVTPYYLMTAMSDPRDRDVSYLCLQVLWVLYHLASMCSVVEPAYLTQLEIEKTEYLVSRHLRLVRAYEPVHAELELFMRQLVFSKPAYSPMGVCTLSRQLCVSVLGAVTTYLVIILQFRATEK